MDEGITINKAQKELLVIEAIRKEILRGLSILLMVSIVFIFLRIILKLLGANPSTFFVGFIYLISGIFLLPFYGIFPNLREASTAGRMTFDGAALIALFCYIVLIPLAMGITQIGAKMVKTIKQLTKTVEKSQPVDTSVIRHSLE